MVNSLSPTPQSPWDKEQPVMLYIRHLIRKYCPEVGVRHDLALSKKYKIKIVNHPAAGVGGFVNRKTKHNKLSRHAEGRGCDIYVNIDTELLREFGDRLFQALAASGVSLGIEDLIWNDMVWTAKKPWVHAYGDTDHRDHLHVGFSRPASQNCDPALDKIVWQASQNARLFCAPRRPRVPFGFD